MWGAATRARSACIARRCAGGSTARATKPLNRNGQGVKGLGLFVDDRISPELGQQANEPLIIAHRASVFFGTDLQVRLSAQGIDTLLMVGIASTGVMLSSVAYASDADFRLFTVKETSAHQEMILQQRCATPSAE